MSIELQYHFDDKAIRAVEKRLLQAVSNPKKAYSEIGGYLVSQVKRRFKQGVDVNERPLIPSQRALDQGGKTLVDHGHLRDSYLAQTFSAGVTVGSGLVYAAIHHFGGLAGRKSRRVAMPARPVLGVNDQDASAIVQIMHRYIAEAAL